MRGNLRKIAAELKSAEIRTYYGLRLGRALRAPTAREVNVQCPFHADRRPSLSVNLETGLWNCHAGCGGGSVYGFEMRLAGCNFVEAKRRVFEAVGRAMEPGPMEGRKVVAEYNYTDENSVLLYQVVRFDPKDFLQRRPNGSGGWKYSLGNVRRVPYQLPALITAREVFICEGEKDCDRLASLGLIATTNPNGADGWLPEFAKYFGGKRVYIPPDNDEDGRGHARDVAANLHPVAASVKVLELPGLAPKGDVSDWLDAGHQKNELLKLAARAMDWVPRAESQRPTIEIVPADQFLGRKAEDELPWLVESLLPAQSQTIWQGRPKVGKSHTLLQLAFDSAAGLPVFGHFATPRPVRVLYAELEEPETITKQRFAGMLRAHNGSGPESRNLYFLSRNDLYRLKLLPRELLSTRLKEFAGIIRDFGVELVILIALRKLVYGDRDDQQVAEAFNDTLDYLAAETKASLDLGHHDRKAPAQTAEARGLGSTMYSARADAIFDLSRTRDGLRRVEVEARYPAMEGFCLRLERVGDGELIRFAEKLEEPKGSAVRERVAAGESIRHAAREEGIPYATAWRQTHD